MFNTGFIKIVKGSPSVPHSSDNALIALFVKLNGDWDSSKTNVATSTRFPQAKSEFRLWFRSQENFKLGEFKIITVSSSTQIAFLLTDSLPEYNKIALKSLSAFCDQNKLSLHIKKPSNIDSWNNLNSILIEFFKSTNVFVYED